METVPDGRRSSASKLQELEDRISAARAAQGGVEGDGGEEYKQGSLAWRMVTELVVGVLVGGAMGWGLDALFGTLPIFLIVMGLMGFAAGVRTMMRSADEVAAYQRRKAQGDRPAPGQTSPNGRS